MISRLLKFVGFIVVALIAIGTCSKPDKKEEPYSYSELKYGHASPGAAPALETLKLPDPPSTPKGEPLAQWSYSESKDEMGRGTIKYASVESTNLVQFEFPYQGPQKAVLQLRRHPKHGRDVILYLERAQFLCHIDDCNLSIRFGTGKEQRWTGSTAADGSTNVVFIRDFKRFLKQLRNAKTLAIEASFYQQGSRVFNFDVAGLDWKD